MPVSAHHLEHIEGGVGETPVVHAADKEAYGRPHLPIGLDHLGHLFKEGLLDPRDAPAGRPDQFGDLLVARQGKALPVCYIKQTVIALGGIVLRITQSSRTLWQLSPG
mgnify:CR=1 FL=1